MKRNRSMLRVEELERRENPSATSISINSVMDVAPPAPISVAADVAQIPVPVQDHAPQRLDYYGEYYIPPLKNPPDTVVGASGTGSSRVRSFSPNTGTEHLSFNAFESSFTGGITVATGDFNGDNVKDIIVSAGVGGGPRVSVFDGVNGRELFSFYAFEAGFAGGLSVATGDVNGDGQTDIIVGTLNGSSHVKVFDGKTHSEIFSFFAFDGFQGGVNVASAGSTDILVGTQSGSSHVKVLNGRDGTVLSSFLAFDASYKGGVSVAAGDFNGDGLQDILVGSLRNANHVKVFNGRDHSELASFLTDDTTSENAGVSVATIYAESQPFYDIGVGSRTGSHLKVFRLGGSEVKSFSAFETEYPGGISVASQTEYFIPFYLM